VQPQHTPAPLTPSLVERREVYERRRGELRTWRNKLERFDHIENSDLGAVLERKVRALEAEVERLRLEWWEPRQVMIARIIEAEGITGPARVRRLEELSMDPDWRLEAVDDALRRLQANEPDGPLIATAGRPSERPSPR
jgi:hypothetical protein